MNFQDQRIGASSLVSDRLNEPSLDFRVVRGRPGKPLGWLQNNVSEPHVVERRDFLLQTAIAAIGVHLSRRHRVGYRVRHDLAVSGHRDRFKLPVTARYLTDQLTPESDLE